MCAASLFGTIVAQVNEIVGDLTTKKKDLDKILESYLVLNPRYYFSAFRFKMHSYTHISHTRKFESQPHAFDFNHPFMNVNI